MNGKTYHIAEIFASLQGEGAHTGMAAVFVRFSGCNLRCSFCDTDFSPKMHLSADQIVDQIRLAAGECPVRNVILTGGEPGLQVDAELVNTLHEAGFAIHVETNGTCQLPEGIDWITCSPKTTDVSQIHLLRADEVKVVFTWGDDAEADDAADVAVNVAVNVAANVAADVAVNVAVDDAANVAVEASDAQVASYASIIERLKPLSLRLQPCDTANPATTASNTRGAIAYILRHPEWRLSLQTHKFLNIR